MTTVNNEITTAKSDIQRAALIYSQFSGKRFDSCELRLIVSPAFESGQPACIVGLGRCQHRNNGQF